MNPLLAVQDLSVAYGLIRAVEGVTLLVPAGGIVTVIGPNGAGKSTLLAAIMGLLPSVGEVQFSGRNLKHADVEERVESGLVLVPEQRELFVQMSVEDNLLLGSYARRSTGAGQRKAALGDMYQHFPRLGERRRQLAGTLSGGERQMLALARALMSKPRLLMLDEPSLGLAPLIVREVLEIVAGLSRAGVSILLIEQNARAALAIADYGYVLEMGVVTAHGSSAELADNQHVATAYLGAQNQ